MGAVVPAAFNSYQIGTSSVSITASANYNNQLIGQIVDRRGRTSGFGAGAITDKPAYYAYDCGGFTTCVWYGVIKVDIASDHGDSGSGFYRVWVSGTAHRSAYGVLRGGTPGVSPIYYSPVPEMDDPNWSSTWFPEPCTTPTC